MTEPQTSTTTTNAWRNLTKGELLREMERIREEAMTIDALVSLSLSEAWSFSESAMQKDLEAGINIEKLCFLIGTLQNKANSIVHIADACI